MIEIKGICKSFGLLTAVNNVTLTVPDNCIYGILGTNGAGKSTLLRIISGILEPDGGVINMDGEAAGKGSSKERLFFLSDDQYYFPNATPLSMAAFYESMYLRFDTERFREILKHFELPGHRKLSTFSKGMKKQVFLFAGLCAGTEYLLCDEVFDGLDPVIRNSIKKILEQEMNNRKFTILAASHNLRELQDICHTIGILHKGGVLLSRDLSEIQMQSIKLQCIFQEDKEEELRKRLLISIFERQGFVSRFIVKGNKEEVCGVIEEMKPLCYELLPMTIEEIFTNETEAAGYDIHAVLS